MRNSDGVKIFHDFLEGKDQRFELRYRIFGLPLHQAPIVLVNHALTGNSNVAGENGWWKALIGEGKRIDLQKYTVIAFDLPGNGFEGNAEIRNYQKLNTQVVAEMLWKALETLGISSLFAAIGGSLGGSIAWEMALLKPDKIQNLIPIACSIRSSDWLIGNVQVQDYILNHSAEPIKMARQHAMLLYRTPQSMTLKFNKKKEDQKYAVESWLQYHGESLDQRFQLHAYKTMNHLLKTIGQNLTDEQLEEFSKNTTSKITIIAVDSDYLFTKEEQWQCFLLLKKYNRSIQYREIHSAHGHDAFLIEYEQLSKLLQPIFG